MQYKILVVSRFGVEKITKTELLRMGYSDIEVSDGQMTFMGDREAVAKANVMLRTAERVMIVLNECEVKSFEDVFQGVLSIPWGDLLPKDAFIHVTAKSIRSKVYSIKDIQSVSKKAIVNKLKKKYNVDWLDESGIRYRIEVGILKDKMTVCLDTSGEGLHKRGYRKLVGEAPISETLACAMLMISRWHPQKTLVDPFCGSGTIPIEAALMGIHHAPGLNRSFRAETYDFIGKDIFEEVKNQARNQIDYDKEMKIIGTDINDEALKMARYHASLAGVDENIHFQRMDMRKMQFKEKNGVIITNPPYGERLLEDDEIKKLYGDMRKVFDSFDSWSKYIITAYADFEKVYGQKANKRRKLYNGMIACQFYQYY